MDTLVVTLPEAYNTMLSSDASFEIVTSQTITKLNLSYDVNTVSHVIGVIFCTTKDETLVFAPQIEGSLDECKAAVRLFCKVLSMKDVRVFFDMSVSQ